MSELYEKSLLKLELDQVLSLLAECAGSYDGKEACMQLRPTSDLEDVQQLLAETTAASELCTRRGNPNFSDIHDPTASLERADRGGSLQSKELLRIASVLRCARNIKSYQSEDENRTILDPLFLALSPNKYLEDRIFGAILSEEEIADDASPGLKSVRRSMKVTADKIREQLNSIVSSQETKGMLQDSLVTMRNGRYCLPVKQEYKGQFNGLIHDQSAKGSTVFMEPAAVVKLNNELSELMLKEAKEIEKILAELSAQAAVHTEDLKYNIDTLIELDFIFARASLAKAIQNSAHSSVSKSPTIRKIIWKFMRNLFSKNKRKTQVNL